jgi:uncharacterized protein (DUF58 family)
MTKSSYIPGISIEVDDLVRVRGQISELSLVNIQRHSSYRSGARDVRVRGRGMEYEETRAYVSGDDVRTMDWRVMARTGEAHTKVFAEEKERHFLLAVDLSWSMFFGTRYGFKSWAAALTTAHIGWLASLSGGRIGGLIVTPDSQHEVRPGRTRSGLMGIFHHLAETSKIVLPPASNENRLNLLLGETLRVIRPGSNVSLISDFIGLDEMSAEIISGITRHSDINLFWIHDDTETSPWASGHYQVLTGNRSIGIDVTENPAASWPAQLQREHRLKIESLASRFSLPLYTISCNRDITAQIALQLKA